MYVATVIPIARGIPFDTLTYYAHEALTQGTLVSIPFGKQLIFGIIIETVPLAEAKTLIKSASFSLKKIKQVLGHSAYFEEVVGTLRTASSLSLAPLGAIAGSTIPQFLFEYIHGEKIRDILSSTKENERVFTERVIAAPSRDRIDEYKRLIRTAFAAKKSVYVTAPTIRALEHLFRELSKGIQKHVVILHSKVTKKNLRSAFAQLKSNERPLLVLVSPGFLLTPRNDIGYLIAEQEGSSLYKTNDRYGIDIRLVIKAFAECAKLELVWGDAIPRIETLSRLGSSHLPRTYVPQKLHIVPVEPYKTTLPSEVIDLVRHAQKKKFRLFIYTNRKGIAPLSRCADCGTVVGCPTCSLPMVLRYKITQDGQRVRTFICTHCGDTRPNDYLCEHCGSWNITPLAIGTESVAEELVSLVGEESVVVIDDDLTPDSASIEKLLASIHQKKFAVIVGTPKVLPYLRSIQYTLIPYMDRILSTPSLSTSESALRLVMECNEVSSEGVLVFTRHPDYPFLKQLASQKINTILDEEITLRKELGYPPFGLLIKVSVTVPEGHRQKVKEYVSYFFADMEYSVLPARRISPGSMKVLLVWVIKAPLSYIEDEGQRMLAMLESLRFPYKVEQNPDRF